jgi:hypothetical protein
MVIAYWKSTKNAPTLAKTADYVPVLATYVDAKNPYQRTSPPTTPELQGII